jgi:hypothetical protein
MLLCYSRMLYVEFTLGEALEHFLGCQENALEFFGATPGAMVIDNLKTGVLSHPLGEKALFHPRYLEFTAHYGFEPRACNVRKANEKGRVENAVGYVKRNFLAGLELPSSLAALNTAVRDWMDQIANPRIHAEAKKRPIDLFAEEKPHLKPLPPLPADTSVVRTVRATSRCRVVLDTNRYSVPALYACARLTLKLFANRLCLYHDDKLVATHPRGYERHRDFENPEHVKELLDQRRRARDAKLLLRFYALSPRAEAYHHELAQRRLNPRTHINKIVALADIYSADKPARALEDALAAVGGWRDAGCLGAHRQREALHRQICQTCKVFHRHRAERHQESTGTWRSHPRRGGRAEYQLSFCGVGRNTSPSLAACSPRSSRRTIYRSFDFREGEGTYVGRADPGEAL